MRTAERGAIDFVTFEDTLTLQPDRRDGGDRVDEIRGRLDAQLLAARGGAGHLPDRAGPYW